MECGGAPYPKGAGARSAAEDTRSP